jgi:hypothetical protein
MPSSDRFKAPNLIVGGLLSANLRLFVDCLAEVLALFEER